MKKPINPDQAPVAAPPRKPPEELNWPGQPARICGNCQHLKVPEGARKGTCHNLISGRWEAMRNESACARGWYPSVERFPIEKVYNP